MISTYSIVGSEVHLHRDAGVIFTKDLMFKKDLLFWKFIENFNILAKRMKTKKLDIKAFLDKNTLTE